MHHVHRLRHHDGMWVMPRGVIRRSTHAAGTSWRKWDPPYVVEPEKINAFDLLFWVEMFVIGALLGLAIGVVR